MPRIALRIEDIGNPFRRRAWVAEIVGYEDKFYYARRFLRPVVDYSDANSVGTRGVYRYYWLELGKIYDVSEPLTWRKTDRYFCRVGELGNIEKINSNDVDEFIESQGSWLGFLGNEVVSFQGPIPTSTIYLMDDPHE